MATLILLDSNNDHYVYVISSFMNGQEDIHMYTLL